MGLRQRATAILYASVTVEKGAQAAALGIKGLIWREVRMPQASPCPLAGHFCCHDQVHKGASIAYVKLPPVEATKKPAPGCSAACGEDEAAAESCSIVRAADQDLVARAGGQGRIRRDEGLMASKITLAAHLVGVALASEDWTQSGWNAGGKIGDICIHHSQCSAIPNSNVNRAAQRIPA